METPIPFPHRDNKHSQNQSTMASRSWRLITSWPRRLDALPCQVATAIETAALTVRMVVAQFSDPDTAISEVATSSDPLLRFALRHDDCEEPLSPSEQHRLVQEVCNAHGLNEAELSFSSLMRSDLTNRRLWDIPELDILRIFHRRDEDEPWALAETTGNPNEANEVEWMGEGTLQVAIGERSGEFNRSGDDFLYFSSATFPPVIRIMFNPQGEAEETIHTLRYVFFEGLFLWRSSETGKLEVGIRPADYILMGVIRHRSGEDDNLERVRFYGDGGLYVTPSLPDGKYTQRPYVSDGWELGEEGFIYTLLYIPSRPPPEDTYHDEFISEDVLQQDGMPSELFAGAELFPRLPGRRAGALDEEDPQPTSADSTQLDPIGLQELRAEVNAARQLIAQLHEENEQLKAENISLREQGRRPSPEDY
ncbi:uncharacterized protein B0H64DRAFT_394644 [Chaetomium fimeti]|uniref:Uncharacterized protein n=1 Tax=Chaetomium fimeti TaxID=1854472 RepID=A0AAE0HFH3_9PEZI|nr:hypothetical protein B0H64DRAFT_394644 [Chaetomium fimeti]